MEHDPKKRFSNRVENYVKYRPSYPQAVWDCLRDECGLTPTAVIADLGSGTGISSKLFLDNGNTVYGIEPNDEMRQAAETGMSDYSNFISIKGQAEATTLPDHSIDFAIAGQAFHWFDPLKTRSEAQRILKPSGIAVLVWNVRDVNGSAFMAAYEALTNEFGEKYQEVRHHLVDERIPAFFGEFPTERQFSNTQLFDFSGLKGRFLSSSYAPVVGHPQHEPAIVALQALFDTHQEAGKVRFLYNTKVTFGQIV